MRDIYSDGRIIRAQTFDISNEGTDVKIDLLIYNKINQDGSVLSSVVHVSDPRPANIEDPIQYDYTKIFQNVTLNEGNFGDDYTWTEVTQFNTLVSFKKLMATYNSMPIGFDATITYAPTLGNDELIYDGWYTIQTRAVPTVTDVSGLKKFEWGYMQSTGTVIYALMDNPPDLGETSMIHSINAQSDEVFNSRHFKGSILSEDFFILTHSLTMYADLLNKDLTKEWYSQFMSIKPKIRSIQAAIEQKKFSEAQYILQSLDYALIIQLI